VRAELSSIEETLIQVRGGGWAHEPRIRSHLSWLATAASSQRGIQFDAKPTDQLWDRYRDLTDELNAELVKVRELVDGKVHELRELLREIVE